MCSLQQITGVHYGSLPPWREGGEYADTSESIHQYVWGFNSVQHISSPAHVGTKNFRVTYNYDGNDQLCLIGAECGSKPDKTSVTLVKDTNNSDYDPTKYVHMYKSKVEYECGLGRRFDMGSSSTQQKLTYECLETVSSFLIDPDVCPTQHPCQGAWSPTVDLKECIWTHCIQAPVATDGSNLTALEYQVLLGN